MHDIGFDFYNKVSMLFNYYTSLTIMGWPVVGINFRSVFYNHVLGLISSVVEPHDGGQWEVGLPKK